MKFYDARNLKRLRYVRNITEMISTHCLDQAVDAIFDVLTSDQKIKIAQSLGYVTEDKFQKYLKVKEFVETLKKINRNKFFELEFYKDGIDIKYSDLTEKEIPLLENLSEVEKVKKFPAKNYDPYVDEDDEYHMILKDCDLKKDIETCLDSGISLEF